jgi:hypothetical protein
MTTIIGVSGIFAKPTESYDDRKAREEREDAVLENLFPDMKKRHDNLVGSLDDAVYALNTEYKRFRRELAESPHERLMLCGRLIDMCDADTAELLAGEIHPLTFDDVLASIEAMAAKVRAMKARNGA